MKTVRVIKAKKELPGFMKANRVFIEYGTVSGRFYPQDVESEYVNGIGIELAMFEQNGGIDEWFEELESIPFKGTTWYDKVKDELEAEKKYLEDTIKDCNDRLENINEFF